MALAALDFETTGRQPGADRITQVAIVPFDGSQPFNRYVEDDLEAVADWLHEWAAPKRLTLVAHNLPFDWAFMSCWLGRDRADDLFVWPHRCTLQLALFCGCKRLSLGALCKQFGIALDRPHDALYDAYACAELYRELNNRFLRKIL